MSTPALDQLVQDLQHEFDTNSRGQRITKLMASYAADHEDWRVFAMASEDSYTRNLVARCDSFELLILCWGAGHTSPIHNHENEDCWLAVLEGQVEEVRYVTPAEVRPGTLEPRDSAVFDAGQVAFIRDDIALHLVRPAGNPQHAVSLHLYATPFDQCNVYCPDTGATQRMTMLNYSERGVLCPTS